MAAPNALQALQAHYDGLEKKAIKHGLISFEMYAEPLTMEDHLEVKDANDSSNSSLRAQRLAAFLVKKLRLEDGTPAFRSPKGDAAEALATSVDPSVIWDLLGQVLDGEEAKAVEDLGKKSEAGDNP